MIPVIRGVVIGLCLIALVTVFGARRQQPVGVSESNGSIKTLYIQFTEGSAGIAADVYRELFRHLHCQVIVGCPGENDWKRFIELMREGGVPSLERFQPAIASHPISTWARDRFTAVRVGERLRLLVPENPPLTPGGRNDWLVAWDLARTVGAEVRMLPLEFDGGDLWITSSLLFAHNDLLRKNNGKTKEEVEKILREEIGLPVIFVEGPPHHLGMFVTPLGDDAVMIADAELGRRLSNVGDYSHGWLPSLDKLRDHLQGIGMRVISLPFAPTENDRQYITYNNVIIDGRRVFMPTYDVPELDLAAAAAWRSAGYDVHPIPAAHLIPLGGAVHCLANILDRNGD